MGTERAGTVSAFLIAHDQELRTGAELDGASNVTRIGPLWLGRHGDRGFTTYRDLGGATGPELDSLIEAVITHFSSDPQLVAFEWKTRGHDAPDDLGERLRAAGLVAEVAETVMIGRAAALAVPVATPQGVLIRRAGEGGDVVADVEAVGALHRTVFGPEAPNRDREVLAAIAADPAGNELWLAEADGGVVAAGRLVRVRSARFAGMFGGATAPQWRHAGVYRALTAARARSALVMGAELVYAECTELSRPILARSGMLAVTTTTPYLWRRTTTQPGSRPAP